DFLGAFDPFGEPVDILGRWDNCGCRAERDAGTGGVHGVLLRHVPGQYQYRYTTSARGVLHSDACHARQLPRMADQLAVVRALLEQLLWMRLLEESGADLIRRNVRRDRQHGSAGTLRVVQSL